MTYQVHGLSSSGNCYKVRLVLEQLILPYVWHEVDMMAGATRTDANHEEVEFVARFKVDGRAHRLHEASRFTRNEVSHWIYIDGDIKNK